MWRTNKLEESGMGVDKTVGEGRKRSTFDPDHR